MPSLFSCAACGQNLTAVSFALRLPSRLAIGAIAFWIGLAPLHAFAKTPRCAGVDYGSGMVASIVSEPAAQALNEAHAQIVSDAPQLLSNYLHDAPYAPHVSVIYDITEARQTPAQQAVHAFVSRSKASSLSFGGLMYWDDAKGSKTTLVVAIDDPDAALSHLHDALAQAAHIQSRFAYHPHVTLAYLQPQARLPAALEALLKQRLAGVHWPARAFFVTDACSQRTFCEELH